jgi:hypothetical protein
MLSQCIRWPLPRRNVTMRLPQAQASALILVAAWPRLRAQGLPEGMIVTMPAGVTINEQLSLRVLFLLPSPSHFDSPPFAH